MKLKKLFILDCKLLAKNKLQYLKLLLFPAVIIAILGFVFSKGSDVKIAPFTVAFLNNDIPSGASSTDSLGSVFKSDALQNSQVNSTIRVVDVLSDNEAAQLLNDRKASIYIRIPKGFTNKYLSGYSAQIQIDAENASDIQREMINSIVRSYMQNINMKRNLLTAVTNEALTQHTDADVVKRTIAKIGTDAQQTDLLVQSPTGERPPISSMQYYSMAITLMFSILTAVTLIHSIVDEKLNGTFMRIEAAPISRVEFIFGKLLSITLSVFLQILILIIFTSLVYHANWGNPGLVLVTTSLYSLMVGALALSLGLVASNQASVSSYSSLLLWGGGFLGGSFIKLNNIGGPLEIIYHIIPNGAALEAYLGIANGNGLQIIITNLLDIALFAALFLSVCVVSQYERGGTLHARTVKNAA
ncbi:MAG: ABC transporter permease [Bacillota bacterium]|nr:ABC transporter permease [Bacillota bacterium]